MGQLHTQTKISARPNSTHFSNSQSHKAQSQFSRKSLSVSGHATPRKVNYRNTKSAPKIRKPYANTGTQSHNPENSDPSQRLQQKNHKRNQKQGFSSERDSRFLRSGGGSSQSTENNILSKLSDIQEKLPEEEEQDLMRAKNNLLVEKLAIQNELSIHETPVHSRPDIQMKNVHRQEETRDVNESLLNKHLVQNNSLKAPLKQQQNSQELEGNSNLILLTQSKSISSPKSLASHQSLKASPKSQFMDLPSKNQSDSNFVKASQIEKCSIRANQPITSNQNFSKIKKLERGSSEPNYLRNRQVNTRDGQIQHNGINNSSASKDSKSDLSVNEKQLRKETKFYLYPEPQEMNFCYTLTKNQNTEKQEIFNDPVAPAVTVKDGLDIFRSVSQEFEDHHAYSGSCASQSLENKCQKQSFGQIKGQHDVFQEVQQLKESKQNTLSVGENNMTRKNDSSQGKEQDMTASFSKNIFFIKKSSQRKPHVKLIKKQLKLDTDKPTKQNFMSQKPQKATKVQISRSNYYGSDRSQHSAKSKRISKKFVENSVISSENSEVSDKKSRKSFPVKLAKSFQSDDDSVLSIRKSLRKSLDSKVKDRKSILSKKHSKSKLKIQKQQSNSLTVQKPCKNNQKKTGQRNENIAASKPKNSFEYFDESKDIEITNIKSKHCQQQKLKKQIKHQNLKPSEYQIEQGLTKSKYYQPNKDSKTKPIFVFSNDLTYSYHEIPQNDSKQKTRKVILTGDKNTSNERTKINPISRKQIKSPNFAQNKDSHLSIRVQEKRNALPSDRNPPKIVKFSEMEPNPVELFIENARTVKKSKSTKNYNFAFSNQERQGSSGVLKGEQQKIYQTKLHHGSQIFEEQRQYEKFLSELKELKRIKEIETHLIQQSIERMEKSKSHQKNCQQTLCDADKQQIYKQISEKILKLDKLKDLNRASRNTEPHPTNKQSHKQIRHMERDYQFKIKEKEKSMQGSRYRLHQKSINSSLIDKGRKKYYNGNIDNREEKNSLISSKDNGRHILEEYLLSLDTFESFKSHKLIDSRRSHQSLVSSSRVNKGQKIFNSKALMKPIRTEIRESEQENSDLDKTVKKSKLMIF